ncbi:MAG TPA: endo-1,4-beta-xylanase [Rhodoblastus sp.]|nr:endo-1,4-beta-xylanase [Rhodoblastus sp.]
MISRRDILAGAAASAFSPAAAAEAETLASAAARAGLIYGASIDASASSHPAYLALYKRETQVYVTDVALKFDWLRPAQDVWNFGPADQIVAAARASNKLARGHTLIWNDNAPAWLKTLSLREIERVFDEHIERVVSRYAGALHSWDVVNEPFWPMDHKPGGWRDGPWYAAMGPSYLYRAFRRVAAIDPHVKLTLNEAQCDNDGAWGQSIRPLLSRLVDRMRDTGTPLHAVGLQSHLQSQLPHNYVQYADFVAGLGGKGLEIYLSEFDVNDSALPANPQERDVAVAALARDYLTRTLAIPAVKMVVTWQLADPYSWYRDLAVKAGVKRMPRPLPFDNTLKPKPMRAAMIDTFLARPRH